MKSLLQLTLEQALNHYSSKAVIEALDFIAGLSEDDMKEWTHLLSPDDAARAYAVWRAAQKDPQTSQPGGPKTA